MPTQAGRTHSCDRKGRNRGGRSVCLRAADGAVYPRVCGGTEWGPLLTFRSCGLSPRVRGNRLTNVPPFARGRSIPACAGEPMPPMLPPMPLAGLSPRVRGNRHVKGRLLPIAAVYPRVCGGTYMLHLLRRRASGLSPRVRGEPRHMSKQLVLVKVYPRVCVGTSWPGRQAARHCGLSPRVRGNPRLPVCPDGWHRSIPACAGEPSGFMMSMPRSKVYPRVCGGTVGTKYVMQAATGLSPRVRGNHALRNDA